MEDEKSYESGMEGLEGEGDEDGEHEERRPRPMPVVFAGHPDETGYQDGSLQGSRFSQPRGLALVSDFNTLYVCDFGNNCIRSIDLETEVVETVAGSPHCVCWSMCSACMKVFSQRVLSVPLHARRTKERSSGWPWRVVRIFWPWCHHL